MNFGPDPEAFRCFLRMDNWTYEMPLYDQQINDNISTNSIHSLIYLSLADMTDKMYKLTDTFVLILLIFAVFFICRLYNIK